MFKKLVFTIMAISFVVSSLTQPITVEASPNSEFYNGQWEFCVNNGFLFFNKWTCSTFSEGRYLLFYKGDKEWTLTVNWTQDINFRGKLVTIRQKSYLGDLKVFGNNSVMDYDLIINGGRFCSYNPYQHVIDCTLTTNDTISVIGGDQAIIKIFATKYMTEP